MDTKVVWKLGEFYRYKSNSGNILSQNIIGVCKIKVYKKIFESDEEDEILKEELSLDSIVRSLLTSRTFRSINEKLNEKTWRWKESFEGEAVYKFSRIPHWGPFWEKKVYKVLKEYCPFLTNFVGVKMMSCTKLICDNQGFALPKTNPTIKEKLSRLVDLTIYDKIEGKTLAIQIAQHFSRNEISNMLQQVFAILYMSQLYCYYTHYDMHCSNILLEPNDEFSWFYYKFNNQVSVLLPSSGYRAKIIDFEFSYVGGLQGKNFDGRCELFDLGYTPQRFDPEVDSIRLILNAFSILKDYGKDSSPWTIARSFLKSIETRPFEDKGLFCKSNDPIRTKIFDLVKQADPNFYKFVYKWYERLISYLFHFVSIDQRDLLNKSTKPKFSRTQKFNSETNQTEINLKLLANVNDLVNEIIQYFRFMYSFKPKGVLKASEILCFIKIYDWIQHKQENVLTDNQKKQFSFFAKRLSKPLYDLYFDMINISFPLKPYNSSENWIQWNLMKQTKKYDSSLVFDPIVALDLVAGYIPTSKPKVTEKNVCVVSFDLNQEQSVILTDEQQQQLTLTLDPFQRASLFETFFSSTLNK